MKIRDRIKDFRRVKASEILPNPANWRTHPKKQQDALRAVLAEVGIADALLVRETDEGLQLLDGHLRADAAPDTDWPVLVLDVDDADAAKLLATFDPLAGMAGTDAEKLEELLREIDTESAALAALLQDLASDAGLQLEEPPELEEDDPPELPAVPVTKAGDVWTLGPHRLLCGDATKAESIERLMAGEQAAMVFTDPPYNVDYTGGTKQALKIENDKMEGEAFYSFLRDSYARMLEATVPGGAIYVCHASCESVNFITAAEDAGWLIKQCLIWVKNSLVLGRQDYQWRHEPILYGWKPGAAHAWHAGRKETTVLEDRYGMSIDEDDGSYLVTVSTGDGAAVIRVPSYEVLHEQSADTETIWRVPKPKRNSDHPTMKPVRVPSMGIANSSRRGEIVLDLFGGSGSTMSACQQTGRRCFAMELSPGYCDVIVKRWEQLTGGKATRGETS